VYQVACQSLSSVLPLHLKQDKTRHDENSTIVYEREGEVNLDAYEPDLQVEQAGVAHLVHGWVQQNIESRVFFYSLGSMHNLLINCIITIRGFLYLVILHIPVPHWLEQGPTIL
jgi:hypothetical protein